MNIRITLETSPEALKFDPPANWDAEQRQFVASVLTPPLDAVRPEGYVIAQEDDQIVLTAQPTTAAEWQATLTAVRSAQCRTHPSPELLAWAALLP